MVSFHGRNWIVFFVEAGAAAARRAAEASAEITYEDRQFSDRRKLTMIHVKSFLDPKTTAKIHVSFN